MNNTEIWSAERGRHSLLLLEWRGILFLDVMSQLSQINNMISNECPSFMAMVMVSTYFVPNENPKISGKYLLVYIGDAMWCILNTTLFLYFKSVENKPKMTLEVFCYMTPGPHDPRVFNNNHPGCHHTSASAVGSWWDYTLNPDPCILHMQIQSKLWTCCNSNLDLPTLLASQTYQVAKNIFYVVVNFLPRHPVLIFYLDNRYLPNSSLPSPPPTRVNTASLGPHEGLPHAS